MRIDAIVYVFSETLIFFSPTFFNNVKRLLPILLSMMDHGVVYCVCVLVDEGVECGIVAARW